MSSVCGLADGFSFCPHSIEFRNKETGKLVTFPFNGHIWYAKTYELKINPAKALQSSVLTATVYIVNTNPKVIYNQDISWINVEAEAAANAEAKANEGEAAANAKAKANEVKAAEDAKA